ncbi:MAG TPA: TrkH family potassium uptake protein [Candidatus Cloacimonadota bacterium]|jgi:trk system potassium uptake protein TrkH|nr:TrkH family potassium uptake protein [Candidatus Cloacimonadales bacterium]HPY95708.1 TrkH family potassium uptake protein [Candidatus Cloacimonadota bacterium]HQB40380.1 TrkH family potassium uptake protein [Candidatus Cloacimonadota bacterium]
MKRLIASFDFLLLLTALINLFLIMLVPEHASAKIGHFNNIYTYGLIVLLLMRTVLALTRDSFSNQSIRRQIIDLFFICISFFVMRYSLKFVQFYFLVRETVIILHKFSAKKTNTSKYNNLFKYPALWVVMSFFTAIMIGSFVLLLPKMQVMGANLMYVDTLFTATSAVCVTGLLTIDISTVFSRFGQMVILMLIQMGGLGIMTISSSLVLVLRDKLSLRSGLLMQNVLDRSYSVDFALLLKRVLLFTFSVEFLGAVFLVYPFYRELNSFTKAVYYAIFHSISAFCNAGISLFPDNLIRFQANPIVNIVITTLIIVGGLGFIVINDSKKLLQHRGHFSQLKLHSKIVIITTAWIVILGTLFFFISEYNYTIKALNFFEKILASYFQSVTARTAGFSTIDFANINDATVLLTVILMYIGASPGSTGGGIKTTTFAIIVLSVISVIRGNRDLVIFNRHISETTLLKAMALIALSLFFVLSIFFILTFIEPFSFEKLFFEVFSAFSTSGLSMGITSLFSSVGKLLLITLMFIGRVGPLTLVFLLSEHVTPLKYAVPQENVEIG